MRRVAARLPVAMAMAMAMATDVAFLLMGGSIAVTAGSTAGPAHAMGGTASAGAHLIGVPLVIASGWTIAGTDLWVMILVIGALAAGLLFLHERATTARPSGAVAAVALLTVLAFDVGMGGWMVLLHLNGLMPAATEAAFWFLMQIGVVLGLVTGYPVVARLARGNRSAAPAGA